MKSLSGESARASALRDLWAARWTAATWRARSIRRLSEVTRSADPVSDNLRRRSVYQAVREATLTTARREDFRIVHLSLQRTHIHLLVEADNKHALALGMQGFQVSAAKHLSAAISKGRPGPRRRGCVFPDRYHADAVCLRDRRRGARSERGGLRTAPSARHRRCADAGGQPVEDRRWRDEHADGSLLRRASSRRRAIRGAAAGTAGHAARRPARPSVLLGG